MGGYRSKEIAIHKTFPTCGSKDCQVITTFANNCAMVARPDSGAKSLNDLFIAFDPDPQKAILKSVELCEAKFGNNNCSYWGRGGVDNVAYCVGYDYKVFLE